MKRPVLLVGLLSLFLCVSGISLAQAVYGTIVGTVTDSSGAAVPSAKITILDVNKGVSYSVTTNESGNYTQGHLIAGTYEIRVEANGFQTFVQKNANVSVDTVTQVDAKLNIGTV